MRQLNKVTEKYSDHINRYIMKHLPFKTAGGFFMSKVAKNNTTLLVFTLIMSKVSQNTNTLLIFTLIMSKVSQKKITLLVFTLIMSKIAKNITTLLVFTLIMSKVAQINITLLIPRPLPINKNSRYPRQGYLLKHLYVHLSFFPSISSGLSFASISALSTSI